MNIYKKNLFIMVIIIFTFIFPLQKVYGEEANNSNYRVYIIVANKLSLLDIDNMPNLNRLIDEGSIGLMNVRGLIGYTGGEGFATINASNKSYANNESSEFHNLNEEYRNLYENRTNFSSADYNIGNIQMGKLYNQNENNNYSPYIGALGDSLHEAGFKTAVFGNSDTDEEYIRVSALIPMDSKGLIDYGNLDNILMKDTKYPYNLKTDYDKILMEISQIEKDTALIVVDTGDLHRLSSYGNFLSADVFDKKRNMILKDIDNFIGELKDNLDKENSLLMVISPNRAEERIDRSRLAPIVIWGKDIDKGVLTSPTTNKKGIVTNLDIAPTISRFLKISNNNMSGSSLQIIKEDKAMDYIVNINQRINIVNKIRTKALYTYGTISILVMGVLILLFVFKINLNNKIGESIKALLLLLYTIPMIFILISVFNINNLFKFFMFLTAFIIILLFIIWQWDKRKLLNYITIIYFILIVLDLLLNNFLTRFSLLSYDPIIGARYFGIGNELIGIFLGTVSVMSSILLERYNNKYIILSLLLFSTILIGHPKLGANVGGTLALIFTLFYFILLIRDGNLSLKNIIITMVLVGVFIAALGYIDIYINPNPTHLGKSLILLNQKGLTIVENIINRKVLMNIKLIGSSIWTKVLFTNILVQIIAINFLKDNMKKLLDKDLGKGVSIGILGSIIGLLLNDSGIILAALSMNLITIFILFRILHGEERFTE